MSLIGKTYAYVFVGFSRKSYAEWKKMSEKCIRELFSILSCYVASDGWSHPVRAGTSILVRRSYSYCNIQFWYCSAWKADALFQKAMVSAFGIFLSKQWGTLCLLYRIDSCWGSRLVSWGTAVVERLMQSNKNKQKGQPKGCLCCQRYSARRVRHDSRSIDWIGI